MKGGLQANSRVRGIRRPGSAGFTIVEVMIVLAVTGLLFVSAAILIGGRQNQTEFDQGIQQIQSQMQLILNEISSGYYPNNGNFQCVRSGSGVNISSGSNAQGTNSDCVFLGKVIQFGSGVAGAGNQPEKFAVHSLTGLRTDPTGEEILVLKDTSPTVIPNVSVETVLEGGITTDSMYYNNKTSSIGAVAIVSSLGQVSSTGLLSGSQQINIIPIDGTTLTQSTSAAIPVIEAHLRTTGIAVNPKNGVQVCFASNGTNQSGLLTIGNNSSTGRELQVTMDIKSGKVC